MNLNFNPGFQFPSYEQMMFCFERNKDLGKPNEWLYNKKYTIFAATKTIAARHFANTCMTKQQVDSEMKFVINEVLQLRYTFNDEILQKFRKALYVCGSGF